MNPIDAYFYVATGMMPQQLFVADIFINGGATAIGDVAAGPREQIAQSCTLVYFHIHMPRPDSGKVSASHASICSGNRAGPKPCPCALDRCLSLEMLFPPSSILNGLELLEEGIDDKCNDHIVDDDYADQVKEEEEKPHPFATRHVFKTNLTLGPVVYDQEIEQDIHTTEHIIEIVCPVLIVDEVTGLQQYV
jgi:hypothetical protein